MGGFQDQSAAEFQRAKARAFRLARIERLDRLGAYLDPLDFDSGARRLRRAGISASARMAVRAQARESKLFKTVPLMRTVYYGA